MGLGLIAFILSVVAASGCAFVAPSGNPGKCFGQLGLFKYSIVDQCTEGAVYSQCIKYTDLMLEEYSNNIRPAQIAGAIAASLGGTLWIVCLFMLFFRFPTCLFKTTGGVFLCCSLAQMLTLLMLNDSRCNGENASDTRIVEVGHGAYQCSLGPDAVISIIAAIFYLGIGITILLCPVPKTAFITCCCNCCKGGCSEDEGACGCCDKNASQGAVIETPSAHIGTNNKSVGIKQASKSTWIETQNDGAITVKEEQIHPEYSRNVSVTTRPNVSDEVSDEVSAVSASV